MTKSGQLERLTCICYEKNMSMHVGAWHMLSSAKVS